MRYGTTMTPAECRRRRPAGLAGRSGAMERIVSLVGAPIMVVNGYLAALTLAAFVRRRTMRRAGGEPAPMPPRYAVLIPAHNEAAVIESTVASVFAQRRNGRSVTVHVVADNCSDETAAIARGLGADVHERTDPERPGKGPALGWLARHLWSRGDDVDAVVIMDADTSMADGFFDAMDRALSTTHRSAWQAYYAVRAPETSPSVAIRYAALALRHYVRPLGRTALGASSGLYGNGMVFKTDLLRGREFSDHLTEDAEFQIELLLDGELVGFVPDAVVEAEMPSTFAAARTQNERWELGRLQVARTYVPRLLRRSFGAGRTHRLAHIDAALDLLVPPLSVLTATTGLLVVAGVAAGGARRPPRLVTATAGSLVLHVLGGLAIVRAPRSVWTGLLHAPRVVIWKLVLLARVVARPGRVAWRRTPRNETVGTEEAG